MTLSAEEFIRRFLLHALPRGFHRIRYFGFSAIATAKRNSPNAVNSRGWRFRKYLQSNLPPRITVTGTKH